jgi:hypothetical protein
MDHDALGHSSILTSLANLTWPKKGVGVATFDPMLRERLVLRYHMPTGFWYTPWPYLVG